MNTLRAFLLSLLTFAAFALAPVGGAIITLRGPTIAPAPGGFAPTDIAGCVLWLDASQITGLSDGDPVATWSDESGTANDAAGSGAQRPTYKTSILNGLPVVRFNGSSNVLLGSISFTGTALSVFAVLKPVSGSNGRVFSAAATGQDDFDSAARAVVMYYNTGTGSIDAFRNLSGLSSQSVSASTWYVLASIFDGTNNTLYKDGTAGSSVGSTGTFSVSHYALGNQVKSGVTDWLQADYAEVIAYDSALNSTNRQLVEDYLGAKYGITIN